MDEHTCETCGARFTTRAELAKHHLAEHSHQSSDGVIVGLPPKEER